MKGLILSGGKGTRLYPLTFTRAKQLIPVANKPVLARVIEAIREADVREVGIVVGPTAPEIKQALGSGDEWDVELTYIQQDSPDGLAHAVKISRDFLADDPFVMFLGDNVIQGGISALIRDFARSQWNSQIVLKEVDNPSAYGVAKMRADGSIERLIEKPQSPPSNLALVGIYMFDKHIFEAVNAIAPIGARRIRDHRCHTVAHRPRAYRLPAYPSRLVDRHRQTHRYAGSQQPCARGDQTLPPRQRQRRCRLDRGCPRDPAGRRAHCE